LTRLPHRRRAGAQQYLASGHNVTMADLVDTVRTIVPDAGLSFPTPERQASYPGHL